MVELGELRYALENLIIAESSMLVGNGDSHLLGNTYTVILSYCSRTKLPQENDRLSSAY